MQFRIHVVMAMLMSREKRERATTREPCKTLAGIPAKREIAADSFLAPSHRQQSGRKQWPIAFDLIFAGGIAERHVPITPPQDATFQHMCDAFRL